MKGGKKIRILVTNDDGIDSANMHALARALSPYGEVFVFAPKTEQSGVSHAFTVRRPLCVEECPCEGRYRVFSVDGTPADCVKFALGHFASFGLEQTEGGGPGCFDVCFSGVNIGENSGVSSLYSGTVAGAREAALWGVPGIALSLHGGNALLQKSIDFAVSLVRFSAFALIKPGCFWNVNFPKVCSADEFRGVKPAQMACGMFTDHYTCEGNLWQLDGEKLWDKQPEFSDDYLLHHGYATITPHRIDQTDEEGVDNAYGVLEKIEEFEDELKRALEDD